MPKVEYYSAIERNAVLIHPTPQMNLENVMLSKSSESQKAIHSMIPFI